MFRPLLTALYFQLLKKTNLVAFNPDDEEERQRRAAAAAAKDAEHVVSAIPKKALPGGEDDDEARRKRERDKEREKDRDRRRKREVIFDALSLSTLVASYFSGLDRVTETAAAPHPAATSPRRWLPTSPP